MCLIVCSYEFSEIAFYSAEEPRDRGRKPARTTRSPEPGTESPATPPPAAPEMNPSARRAHCLSRGVPRLREGRASDGATHGASERQTDSQVR